MDKKDLEKRTEGTNAALGVLSQYMSKRELVNVRKLLRKEDLVSSDVGEYFHKDRAKDVSEILFVNRKDLRSYENIADLYVACEKYYDENTTLNLILGKDAMTPSSMCDIRDDLPPYHYESLY